MAPILKDQLLSVCTHGLEPSTPTFSSSSSSLSSMHAHRRPRSSPSYSSPPPAGLLEQFFGRMLCCATAATSAQVQSELLQEQVVTASPTFFASSPILELATPVMENYDKTYPQDADDDNDDEEEEELAMIQQNWIDLDNDKDDKPTSPRLPFRRSPGLFLDGMDDLRVTHNPSTPVKAPAWGKSYDSCDTQTTAVLSTSDDSHLHPVVDDDDEDVDQPQQPQQQQEQQPVVLQHTKNITQEDDFDDDDDNDSTISCNTVLAFDDDNSSMFSRGVVLHPDFIYPGEHQVLRLSRSFSY